MTDASPPRSDGSHSDASRTTTSRRRFLASVGAAGLAGVAGCAAPATPPSDADLQENPDALFRTDLERRGTRPDESVPDAMTVDWSFPVNSGDHTAAKASFVPTPDGNLLVPGDTGILHSVTPGGEKRWETPLHGGSRGIHGTPAVADGAAFVGTYTGVCYAVDLESGEVRWRKDVGDAIGSSPAYHDGVVYVAVETFEPDGHLVGLDARTGRRIWRDDRPTNHPHSTIAIDADRRKLVVGSNDGYCYAWDYPDLSASWKFPTDGAIKGPVTVHDGLAIFGSWDETVYALNLDDGSPEWTLNTTARVMAGAAADPRTNTVYIGDMDGTVIAIDGASGEVTWTRETGATIVGCPSVVDETVLVGTYDTNVYALDRETGDERVSVANRGWVTSSPLVYDGAVYYTERAPDGSEGDDGMAYRLVPA